MDVLEAPRVSGHVYRQERATGDRWVAKWRDATGQHKRVLGKAWTRRGRPTSGYLTKRGAEDALDRVLAEARRGTLLGVSRSAATFADAAAEWLRHGEVERGLKRSTIGDYASALKSHLLPAFGEQRLDQVTAARIEHWRAAFIAERRQPRTAAKLLAILHGVFERARKVYGLTANPVAAVEKHAPRYSGDYDWYSREEVEALVRAAASEQDAAIFAAAAMSGLRRGELLALRWRDVDFAGFALRVSGNLSHGEVVTPKSGKVRAVPMVRDVAERLARLGQRERFGGEDDPVFIGEAGGHLDASALRRRYAAAVKRSGLRALPFHSLRHHFGSIAVNRASLVQVQAWMGHADVRTTMRYLHHKSRADEAELLAGAFEAMGDSLIAPSEA